MQVVSLFFVLLIVIATAVFLSNVVENVKLRRLYSSFRKKGIVAKNLTLREFKEMKLYCYELAIKSYIDSRKNQIIKNQNKEV